MESTEKILKDLSVCTQFLYRKQQETLFLRVAWGCKVTSYKCLSLSLFEAVDTITLRVC